MLRLLLTEIKGLGTTKVMMAEQVTDTALALLHDLGVLAYFMGGVLTIDRTSMCENFPVSGDENASYQQVLQFLKDEFPDYFVYWLGRTDEFLQVQFKKY